MSLCDFYIVLTHSVSDNSLDCFDLCIESICFIHFYSINKITYYNKYSWILIHEENHALIMTGSHDRP